MPISRQHGEVKSIAKLATLAGQSMAARRDYERREAALERVNAAKTQQVLQTQRLDAQRELAQFRVQSDNQKIMADMQWENQKGILSKQHDFAMVEQREQVLQDRELAREVKKLNEYDLAKEKLDERLADRSITQSQYDQAKVRVDMKHLGFEGVLPRPGQEDPIRALLQQAMTGGAGGETEDGRVRVVSPNGQTGSVPANEVNQYLAQGYKRI